VQSVRSTLTDEPHPDIEIVLSHFSDKVFALVTQLNKIANLVCMEHPHD